MHLSNDIFWKNIETIKDRLLLDDASFAASLGFKPDVYLSYKRKGKSLPMDVLFGLAEKYNFHLEDLLEKSDFSLKYDPYQDHPLLDRYMLARHSQTRAIINILDYVARTRGTRAKINLIRKFQLSEDFIVNEKNRANVFLISDIVRYLTTHHGFTQADFIGIGRRMPFLSSNKVIKEMLTSQKTALETLECFVYDCTKMFDTNCTYSISEYSDEHAIIDVLPNKNVVEELQVNYANFGNEELCLTKMGNFSSTMYFKYGTNAPVKKVNSIHHGHKSNQYYLDLSLFKKENSHLRILN